MSKDKEEKQDSIPEESLNEDVVFEDEGVGPAEFIKKLREKLKECESQKQDYLDGWQRTKADFVNLKGKIDKEKENFLKFATEDIIVQLIPVLDSFELALKGKDSEESQNSWKTGLENIYGQLKTVMFHNGVEEIEPKPGTAFDPAEQEIMSSEVTINEGEDEMIVELIQRGYKLNGKVIKTAKVIIKKLEV